MAGRGARWVVGLWVAGGAAEVEHRVFRARAEAVVGHVTERGPVTRPNGKVVREGVVTWTGADGTAHRSGGWSLVSEGDVIPLLYVAGAWSPVREDFEVAPCAVAFGLAGLVAAVLDGKTRTVTRSG